VQPGALDLRELRDPKVTKEPRAIRESWDPLDLKELREPKVTKVIRELRA
jgi:hypothetical protein